MIWHGLLIFLAVIVSAVPWGLPGETTFIFPFITFLLVFLFSLRQAQPVPPWLVFMAGLATDVLTAGPLGYWAFIYTLGHSFARAFTLKPPSQTVSGIWLAYALTACIVGCAGWLLASVYYVRVIDWWPIALGTLSSILLSPLFVWFMRKPLELGRYRGLAMRF